MKENTKTVKENGLPRYSRNDSKRIFLSGTSI